MLVKELKNLYMKNSELNKLLYKSHVEVLNKIHLTQINNILQYVNIYVKHILHGVYVRQIKKFSMLENKQCPEANVNSKHIFYERVSNPTPTALNNDEMDILNKG